MDQCKIIPLIDRVKEELTAESAFLLPFNREGEDEIKKYLATKTDLGTYKLNDEIIVVDPNGESLTIDNTKCEIASFFEYSINENTGIPIYIYERGETIERSMSLSSLISEDPKFEILKRLNDPSCAHIIADIRNVIQDLQNVGILMQEKSRRIQRFYKYTRANLEQHLLWRNVQEVEFTVDTLEDYILKKCKPSIYGTDEGDKKNNEIFLEKNVDDCDLKLDFLNFEENLGYQTLFEDMSRAKNAREIGEGLVSIHKQITNQNQEMTTDEILERLEKIVRCCKPQTLVLDLLFLQRFHDHRHLESGSLSFCLTNTVNAIKEVILGCGN